ncbi:MAG: hypothetical protein ABI606_19230 [Rhodoferax sp.]
MSLSTSGGGMGQQGGSAASTTTAAISGLAGNQAARTGDKETGIGQIFDADKVSADVNAQAAITQSFGQQASKAVGDYAGNKAKELRAQGNEEEAKKWDEGGTYRATAHAVIGGLTGGASGAAGAGAAAYSADAINQATADLPAGVKNAVGAVMAAGIGATAGGGNVAGVNAALNEDLNNRQLHPTEVQWIKDNGKKFAAQLSETLGHPVSEQEAMQFLTAAGESDVGLDAQRSNGQFVRGTSNTEVAQAYDAAKSFILSSTKTNNSFVDAQGQNQTLFTAKNGDFYKPEVYSQYRNDVQYRDYYWSVMGINLKGDNMSAQEKAVYDQRQIAVNQQTAKDLLTLGAQAVAGKVASGVAGRAGTPGTTTDTNKSGANGGVAVGEIGSGVRVYPDGSLRTPDGKFASVSGSPAPGTTAAANYADFLNKNGVNVVGQEMVVNGPLGPRRYDIVVQDATGNLQGIEIKSGGATKTTYQDFTDRFVNQFGAPGAGKLDGKSVTSTITIYVP